MNIHSLLFGRSLMTPDRETRNKLIAEKRRKQILEAAMLVFSSKGYSAATIPSIAKSAGLAAGTLYLYYPSKRDLFIAVIESFMVAPLSKILDLDDTAEFQVTLKNALENRLHFMQSDLLPRFLSLMGEIQRDPELRTLFVTNLINPFLSRMEEFYASRIKSGEIRKIEPALAVRLVASLMIGMTVLRSLERESSPLNKIAQDELAENLMNFIFYGFMKDNIKNEA
jgi:AcrR family transcriptional regulator